MEGAMQKKLGFVIVLMTCLVGLSHVSSASTSHIVGDSNGWTIPSPSSSYSAWAAKQTFKVGDTLVFNFVPGTHTVAEVTKSDYESCTTINGALAPDTPAPAKMTIPTGGTHYYICTIPSHCRAGQKLQITTATASSATPTPSTASSATPTLSTASSAPPTASAASSAAGPSGPATSPVSTPSDVDGPSTSETSPLPRSLVTLMLPFLLVGVAFLF